MRRPRHCMMDEDYNEDCDGNCESAELCKKLKQHRGNKTIVRLNRGSSINPGQLCFIAYMVILIVAIIVTKPKTGVQVTVFMVGLITITAAAILHQGFEVIHE